MSNDLEKLAKEERNAYLRKWRAENKDKVKAINKRYWEKKARRIVAEKEAAKNE